ncbi:MAG TPA: IS630 family transposase [Gemmata sp.]|nr:IS630 family transposase [Gemmata sp.]
MHVEAHDSLERLQEAARQCRYTRTWPRLQAVILAKQGVQAPAIARALGVSRRAVQAWVAAYNRGGLEALPDRPHPGRRPTLPKDREAQFLERIEAPPRPEDGTCELRGAEIRRILEQEFAARYSLSGVSKLLHRLGFNDLMPRPQYPETHPEAQEFFKEIVVEPIAAIADQHPGQEIQVWHHDEARFGQQGTISRVWARRGSRPRRVRQNGRESLYVLTATWAAAGAAFGLIMPELNTAVVNPFLEEFSRQLAPGVHAVLLGDNAPYHVSGALVVPANVSLINLLPYSPELNPVENLWHYLRAHHWSNRVYADYDALLGAATEAWRKVCLDPEKIRSICAAPYLAERK